MVADDRHRFSKLEALSAVRDDRTLDAKERIVLVMLITHADKSGSCYPSMALLALETGLAERSVAAAIASLRGRGSASPVRVHVSRGPRELASGGRPPNVYTLRRTFSASTAPKSNPTFVQPVQESSAERARDFPANGGGLSCKTRGDFPAPVAEEAVQEAVQVEAGQIPRDDARGAQPALFNAEETSKPARRAAKTRKPSKPSGAPKPDRTAEQTAAHGRVTQAYFLAFEKKTGSKPPFGSRDGKSVWRLLEAVRFDADQAIRVIDNALFSDFGGTESINAIAADPKKFWTRKTRDANGRKFQGQPSGGYFSVESAGEGEF